MRTFNLLGELIRVRFQKSQGRRPPVRDLREGVFSCVCGGQRALCGFFDAEFWPPFCLVSHVFNSMVANAWLGFLIWEKKNDTCLPNSIRLSSAH